MKHRAKGFLEDMYFFWHSQEDVNNVPLSVIISHISEVYNIFNYITILVVFYASSFRSSYNELP